jgi:hypothetical protein
MTKEKKLSSTCLRLMGWGGILWDKYVYIFSTLFIIKNQTEYIVVFNNYSHLHPQKQNNIQSKPTDHPQSKKLQVLITSDGYKHPKQSIAVQTVYCREA